MHRSLVRVSTIAAAFAAAFLSSAPVAAQRVAGVGDDAIVPGRGVVRITTLGQWTFFNERYGSNTPGRADGSIEPIGIDFSRDTLGVREFPELAGLQGDLRSVTGDAGHVLSLGSTRLDLRAQVTTTPILIEAGLTRRIVFTVQVPFVRTQSSGFFAVNPLGNEGNVGFNPALSFPAAAAQNVAMFTQFSAAASSLQASIDSCTANPASSPSCPTILAQEANARALIASSTTFAGDVNRIYSNSRFVPIRNTAAQLAIESRVAAFRAQYVSFGVNNIAAATTGPFPSQTRLTQFDAQTIITDPVSGLGADPIRTVSRSHFGDIDVGGKMLILDTFGNSTAKMSPRGLNLRASVGGVVRLPTGQDESPDNFIDLGAGQGQMDVEGRIFADVGIGSRFWQSFVVRYNNQLADQKDVRIIDLPELPLAPAYRRQRVERDLGNIFEFETTPRLIVNNFFSIAAHYVFRSKAEDKYSGTFVVPAAVTGFSDVTLDASTMNLETEQKEHRLGGGISFSNLYSVSQKKANLPFEVTYLRWQTVKGSGNVPKSFTDQIQLRLYTRLFGN